MRFQATVLWVFALATGLAARTSNASPLTPGQLSMAAEPHRLLGDVLRARFPAETSFRNSASGDITTPDGTMTFVVERAGTVAGRLTLAAIKKHEQPFTPRWTGRAAIKLRLAPGWEGQLFPAARASASTVAYVRAPDRWVYRVWFHVAAERRSAEWTALARRIAESISAGTRSAELAARTLPLFGDVVYLNMPVPAGWDLQRIADPVNLVAHQLRRMGELGTAQPGCDVTLVDVASPIEVPPNQSVRPGAIVGQPVTWVGSGSGARQHARAAVQVEGVGLEVRCEGDAAGLAEAIAVVEAIRGGNQYP